MGDQGEAWVRRLFVQWGHWVVPISLIDNGGAPMLEDWIESNVLPDILAGKDGDTFVVEVKTKSRITYNRLRHRLEGRN